MKERIKQLRTMLGLTQQKFADRLGLKRQTIAAYEVGNIEPSDSTLLLICKEFGVNEKWLRYNEGDIYKSHPPTNEINNAISSVLEDTNCDNSVYTLVKEFLLKYDKLDPKSKDVINKLADDVVNGYTEKREDT